MTSPATHDPLVRRLVSELGAQHVLTTPADVAGYATDWTGAFGGPPRCVVRPGSTDEVAAVVAACRELRVPLVPQGGNTGLVGGGVALRAEVILSTRRLRGRGAFAVEVDRDALVARVGAGVAVQEVRESADRAGLTYGVDLASRGSATLGGTIATNAGGLRVLRHGNTRAQVLGVEAVLGTGAVLSHLAGLTRDNTGYDLGSLLAGSEGTLGVITRAVVRLRPSTPGRAVALVGFADVGAAIDAAATSRRQGRTVSAVELVLAGGLALVGRVAGRRAPLPDTVAAALVVEAEGPDDESAGSDLTDLLGELPGVLEGVLGADSTSRDLLWGWREGHTEAIATLGPAVKMDVTLPAAMLADFVREVPLIVASRAPDAATWLFGHVADGNVHVNVTGVPPPGRDDVQDAVFTAVAERGGSISTEHGIGTAKRRWLHLARTPAEIATFRALKAALDPDGVLNPHALLPPAGPAEPPTG